MMLPLLLPTRRKRSSILLAVLLTAAWPVGVAAALLLPRPKGLAVLPAAPGVPIRGLLVAAAAADAASWPVALLL
jgi:hypothetical protein